MAIRRSAVRKRRVQRPRYSGLLRVRDLHILSVIVLAIVGCLIWWAFWDCGSTACEQEQIGDRLQRLIVIVPGFGSKNSGSGGSAAPMPLQLYAMQGLLWFLAVFGVIRVGIANVRRDLRVILARRRRGHVIVCGLGDTGREIAENLRWQKGGIVAITLDTEEPNAAALELLRVPILKADATHFGVLGLAGLRHAEGVVVTTGSDATNLEVALRVEDELAADQARTWPRIRAWITGSDVARPLFVLPEVRSPWLLDLLHTHPTTTLGSETIETRPFDLYASAARQLLSAAPFRRPLPQGAQPHILLAGLGEMGTQIILQAVCANYAVPGRRLAVTVLDQQGEDAAAGLAARFPGLRDLIDFDFVKAAFAADNAASWNEAWGPIDEVLHRQDEGRVTVAVIAALSDDKDSLHTAMQLRRRLDCLGRLGTPVFVRVRQQRALGEFAAQLDGDKTLFGRLVPFGDLASLTEPEQLIGQSQDQFARALHEAYLATRKPDARPSPAAVPWPQLSEWYKQSNRATADHLPAKLGLVGMRTIPDTGRPAEFTEDEIETMAVAEHERWWVERKVLGWTLGPRDDIRRTHPDMKPWDKLDDGQREYDRSVVRASRANLPTIGRTIRRERIIVAAGDRLAGAEAALDGIGADEVAIVVFDPDEPASWEFARRAAARKAVLWVLWREGRVGAPVAPSAVPAEVRRAVEAAISTQELAALTP
jgi:voltage-gated potassium channel Kch